MKAAAGSGPGGRKDRQGGLQLLALALAAASGAAGLGHQLLWVRRMVDILGADAGTFSRVIAAFFLGLALGSWVAARIPTPRPWRAVALAEGAVALLAFVVLIVGQAGDFGQGNPAIAPLLSWTLPLLLIVPPAFGMGMVVPWMIRACGAELAVPLYAINTLGGIAGLGLTLAWSLPSLGLAGASVVTLGLNIAVAFVAFRMKADRVPESAQRGKPIANMGTTVLSFSSGFLVLAAEVVIQHQLAQVLVSSYSSSALVLTLVLGALGLAAFAVPLFARFGNAALPIALSLSAVAFAIQPVIFIVQRGGIHYLPFEKPPLEYLLTALQLGVPSVALILLPAGLVFPLLLQRASAEGVDAGRLLAVNGAGGWVGAELTARMLLPALGIWHAMAAVAFGYALALLACGGRSRWILIPGLGVLTAWTWQLDGRLPYVGLFGEDRLVKIAVGREGVVSVLKGADDDLRLLMNNTYTLGGTRAKSNQERQALLPMLVHGDAKIIATLGVATGSTLSGATMEPGLESAEGIELSKLVLHFASETFAPFNGDIAHDPKVRLTHGDARWIIGQRAGKFDVIVGDLFLPWSTGEGRLFTKEHFEKVKGALKPNGLYCQWLPMYQLTRPQYDAIVRTFLEVFPDAWILRGDFYTSMPIVGLVGGRSLPSIDWAKTREACQRVKQADICRDPLLRHAEGIAMMVVGPAPPPPPGPTITLANSWLEWNAAKNVVGLGEPWFIGVPLAQYLRDVQRGNPMELPPELRSAQECGDLFLTLEIARASKFPQAEQVEASIVSKLPPELRAEASAGWKAWPMRFPPNSWKNP